MKNLLTILMTFFCVSCNGQRDEKPEASTLILPDSGATPHNPDIEVKVDKKYDEEGNLIGYDSTYSYTYRSFEGDTLFLDMDSLFNDFRLFFKENIGREDPFSLFFEKDSSSYHDCFREDFFHNRFPEREKEFEEMFRQMDSLKNNYFQQKRLQIANSREIWWLPAVGLD